MKKIIFIIAIILGAMSYAQNNEHKKNEKQVYIIHGYDATPNNHWFRWLENELYKKGIKAYCLTMPNAKNPKAEEWLNQMKKDVKINEQTVIVGHSLGTIATLNYLADTKQNVLGIVLVSGFYEPLSWAPQLNPFIEMYKQKATKPNTKHSVVIAALNDSVVPHQLSDNLARHLQAKYVRLPEGGHFLRREGFTSFPLVLDEILRIFDKE